MATFHTSQCQDGSKVYKCYELRYYQDITRHFRNLNTPKAHQEGFFQVILSKNSENSALKPEFKLGTFQCGEFSIDNRCDKRVKNLQL